MSVEPYISKYLFSKASKHKIPLNGTFEISPCCNLDCKMCYIKKSKKEVNELGGEIDADKWISIAKECKQEGMLFLLLTGGEPFLYKDFKRLYLELHKMGFMISINTNGTLIDSETVEWLSKNPPYRMQITLYGGSNETYKRLCNDPKGYDKATNAIKMLKNVGISIKISASMTPYNIDDIDKIYKFGEENNIYVQAATYMFPPVRKDESLVGCGDRFTPDDAAYYSVKIDKMRFTDYEFKQRAINLSKVNEDSINIAKEREKLKCRAGKSSFWINWKGEMTPCGMLNSPVSYPFKDGLIKSWYKIIEETDSIRLPKKCANCNKREACSVCAASVISETGDYNKAPSYICKLTNQVIEYTKQEYELMVNE